MKRPRRILLATDFSAPSGTAWKKAVELAGNGSELVIAHVLRMPVPFSPDGFLLPRTIDELQAAVRRDATELLQSLLAKSRRAGVRATGLLLTGRPEEAIARAAKKKGADLMVVGTHGRTGLSRLFLGSVAARIIALAPCPVLAVPPRFRSGATKKARSYR